MHNKSESERDAREKRDNDGDYDCAAGGDARPASMLFANNLRACSRACQADIMPLTSVLVVLTVDRDSQSLFSDTSIIMSSDERLAGYMYEVGARVGAGAFGEVYAATRASDGLHCVLKFVTVAGVDPKQQHEALNEVRLLSAIAHPQIVSHFESFR